jgi:hypothetical protein
MKIKLLTISTLVLLSTNAFADLVELRANNEPKNCSSGQVCPLTSNHFIGIQNATNEDHRYEYVYTVCGDNNDCHMERNNNLVIKAHSEFRNSYDNYVAAKFNKKGQRSYFAKTEIFGYQTGQKTMFNTVTVY